MKRIAIAAAAALLMLGTAQAQQARTAASPLYGELGYTFLNFEGGGVDADPQALRGIVGYNFHPFFAAEGMLAFGTRSDDGSSSRSLAHPSIDSGSPSSGSSGTRSTASFAAVGSTST